MSSSTWVSLCERWPQDFEVGGFFPLGMLWHTWDFIQHIKHWKHYPMILSKSQILPKKDNKINCDYHHGFTLVDIAEKILYWIIGLPSTKDSQMCTANTLMYLRKKLGKIPNI